MELRRRLHSEVFALQHGLVLDFRYDAFHDSDERLVRNVAVVREIGSVQKFQSVGGVPVSGILKVCHPVIIFVDIVKEGRKEMFYLTTRNRVYTIKYIRRDVDSW